MGVRSKRRARAPATDSPSRRRRKDVHAHGLPWEAEWRDWAELPRDILWFILGLIPQADILRGAGRTCASWRRLVVDEPLLWRHIDLAANEDSDSGSDSDSDSDAWAGRQAMARAAVRRSAGRCESFRGPVDCFFLLYLSDWAPSLRRLDVTCRYDMPRESFISMVPKKLPLLEHLVLSDGLLEGDSLAALVDHWPRLRLLHASGCHTRRPIDKTLRRRLENRIKDLRLPHRLGYLLSARAVPYHP